MFKKINNCCRWLFLRLNFPSAFVVKSWLVDVATMFLHHQSSNLSRLPCKRVSTVSRYHHTRDTRMRSIAKKKFSHIGVLYRCLSDFEAQLRYLFRRPKRLYCAFIGGRPRADRRSFYHPPLLPIAVNRARSSSPMVAQPKKVGLMLPPWIAEIALARLHLRKKHASITRSRVVSRHAFLATLPRSFVAIITEDTPEPRIIDELCALLYLVSLYRTFFALRNPIALSYYPSDLSIELGGRATADPAISPRATGTGWSVPMPWSLILITRHFATTVACTWM